jgi:ComF family protein
VVYGRALSTRFEQTIAALGCEIGRFILPSTCIACGNHGDASDRHLDLCDACQLQLPHNRHACQRCGLPLSGTATHLICGSCLKRPPRYDSSYCAFEYAYPLHHLIRRFKYGNSLSLARMMGGLMGNYLREHHQGDWPTCFIPVPLHPLRFRARGYNQVIELGRFLAAELNVVMRTDLVERHRHTPEQAGLSRRERRKNLRRAFVTKQKDLPAHIAVLDDVITTGSTVNELANALKKAGVPRIEVWGLARATLGV